MSRSAGRITSLLLALAALACSGEPADPATPGDPRNPARPPNIVLVVLDTARADHFSAYGYERATTPAFDRLADDAIRFENAYATSSWTLASHASLFTGLLPVTHRATQENLYLDDELETLAELLAAAGYRTATFSNNSWISRITNLAQGFDETFPMWREGPAEGPPEAHHTNVAVLDWVEAAQRPFFAFVNYIEPHWPYAAPRVYQDRFVPEQVSEKLRARSSFPAMRWYLKPGKYSPAILHVRSAMYDAGLAHVDAILGQLVAGLEQRDLLEQTLLVVTADHGENLGDNGHQGHSFSLFDSTLRIPLLIRPPGGVPGGDVRHDPVQLTDVFATLARAGGATASDPRVTGEDLLAEPLASDRPIVGEYYYPRQFLSRFSPAEQEREVLAPYRRRIRSIHMGDDKLIWGSDGRHALYDLARDPGELNDRREVDSERAAALVRELDRLVSRLERENVVSLTPEQLRDEETLKNLRALGYVE